MPAEQLDQPRSFEYQHDQETEFNPNEAAHIEAAFINFAETPDFKNLEKAEKFKELNFQIGTGLELKQEEISNLIDTNNLSEAEQVASALLLQYYRTINYSYGSPTPRSEAVDKALSDKNFEIVIRESESNPGHLEAGFVQTIDKPSLDKTQISASNQEITPPPEQGTQSESKPNLPPQDQEETQEAGDSAGQEFQETVERSFNPEAPKQDAQSIGEKTILALRLNYEIGSIARNGQQQGPLDIKDLNTLENISNKERSEILNLYGVEEDDNGNFNWEYNRMSPKVKGEGDQNLDGQKLQKRLENNSIYLRSTNQEALQKVNKEALDRVMQSQEQEPPGTPDSTEDNFDGQEAQEEDEEFSKSIKSIEEDLDKDDYEHAAQKISSLVRNNKHLDHYQIIAELNDKIPMNIQTRTDWRAYVALREQKEFSIDTTKLQKEASETNAIWNELQYAETQVSNLTKVQKMNLTHMDTVAQTNALRDRYAKEALDQILAISQVATDSELDSFKQNLEEKGIDTNMLFDSDLSLEEKARELSRQAKAENLEPAQKVEDLDSYFSRLHGELDSQTIKLLEKYKGELTQEDRNKLYNNIDNDPNVIVARKAYEKAQKEAIEKKNEDKDGDKAPDKPDTTKVESTDSPLPQQQDSIDQNADTAPQSPDQEPDQPDQAPPEQEDNVQDNQDLFPSEEDQQQMFNKIAQELNQDQPPPAGDFNERNPDLYPENYPDTGEASTAESPEQQPLSPEVESILQEAGNNPNTIANRLKQNNTLIISLIDQARDNPQSLDLDLLNHELEIQKNYSQALGALETNEAYDDFQKQSQKLNNTAQSLLVSLRAGNSPESRLYANVKEDLRYATLDLDKANPLNSPTQLKQTTEAERANQTTTEPEDQPETAQEAALNQTPPPTPDQQPQPPIQESANQRVQQEEADEEFGNLVRNWRNDGQQVRGNNTIIEGTTVQNPNQQDTQINAKNQTEFFDPNQTQEMQRTSILDPVANPETTAPQASENSTEPSFNVKKGIDTRLQHAIGVLTSENIESAKAQVRFANELNNEYTQSRINELLSRPDLTLQQREILTNYQNGSEQTNNPENNTNSPIPINPEVQNNTQAAIEEAQFNPKAITNGLKASAKELDKAIETQDPDQLSEALSKHSIYLKNVTRLAGQNPDQKTQEHLALHSDLEKMAQDIKAQKLSSDNIKKALSMNPFSKPSINFGQKNLLDLYKKNRKKR